MFMPAIPFLHSGYELAEEYPINTGLDFTGEELKKMPSETLPLFSEFAYDWTRPAQFPALRRASAQDPPEVSCAGDRPRTTRPSGCSTPAASGPRLRAPGRGQSKRLAVVANLDSAGAAQAACPLGRPAKA